MYNGYSDPGYVQIHLNLRSEIWRRSLNENIGREGVHDVSVIFLDSESFYFNGSCYRMGSIKEG